MNKIICNFKRHNRINYVYLIGLYIRHNDISFNSFLAINVFNDIRSLLNAGYLSYSDVFKDLYVRFLNDAN